MRSIFHKFKGPVGHRTSTLTFNCLRRHAACSAVLVSSCLEITPITSLNSSTCAQRQRYPTQQPERYVEETRNGKQP
jgi:hypothetical protein